MTLRDEVEALVSDIQPGRVMTYGDIADCTGHPGAARVIGMIAHQGAPDVPWQRVVNGHGGLAQGYDGGAAGQRAALEAEGVRCDGDRVVDFAARRWWPGDDAVLSGDTMGASDPHFDGARHAELRG